MVKKILLLTGIFLTQSSSLMSESRHSDVFTFEEALPNDVRSVLEKHISDIYEMFQDKRTEDSFCAGANVHRFEWLPGYFIKKLDIEYSRIEGAKKLATAIYTHNLDALTVVPKYPYQAPDGSWYVICVAAFASNQLITLAELKQLARLAKITQWTDCRPDNCIKISEGLVVIIDTEPHFNNCCGYVFTNEYQRKAFIYSLLASNPDMLTPEAFEYISAKAQDYAENWENPEWISRKQAKHKV